jgi:hypothetical protein
MTKANLFPRQSIFQRSKGSNRFGKIPSQFLRVLKILGVGFEDASCGNNPKASLAELQLRRTIPRK